MKKLIIIILMCWVVTLIGVYSIVFVAKKAWNDAVYVKDNHIVYVEKKQNLEYQKFEITAYTSGKESTGKDESHPAFGITASGEPAIERITIACPPTMDFGTKVYIPAFETVFTCQDRGSAITEGKLDIYMENLAHAQMFGRQKLEVIVLP